MSRPAIGLVNTGDVLVVQVLHWESTVVQDPSCSRSPEGPKWGAFLFFIFYNFASFFSLATSVLVFHDAAELAGPDPELNAGLFDANWFRKLLCFLSWRIGGQMASSAREDGIGRASVSPS
jgi:hypothetical protein